MYVKDFKINVVKTKENCWTVKREVTLTNCKDEGIPIIKNEAQAIMGLLDKSAVLDPLFGENHTTKGIQYEENE